MMNGTLPIWIMGSLFTVSTMLGGYLLHQNGQALGELNKIQDERGPVIAVNRERTEALQRALEELKQEMKMNRKLLIEIKGMLK